MDIALDSTIHDIFVKNGDLHTVSGQERVAQQLKISHQTHQGEWAFDRRFGLPFREGVFVKKPPLMNIASLFKDQIASVEDVTAIQDFNISLDGRKLTIKYEVNTEFGVIDQTFTPSTGGFWSSTTMNSEEDV